MKGPTIDWAGLSPLLAVLGGALVVLLVGLLRSRFVRETLVPLLAIGALGAFLGLSIWQWDEDIDLISGAMRVDALAMYLNLLFARRRHRDRAAVVARARAARGRARRVLRAAARPRSAAWPCSSRAQNTVTLFLGFELLSIPLYVLCATEMRRETSLESGLKYLIIGSVGSATLVYGLALLYGATGSTDFAGMAAAIAERRPRVATRCCSPASRSSSSAWRSRRRSRRSTSGRPTSTRARRPPVTAFMAVATKAAAFGVHPAALRRRAHRRAADVGPGARGARDDHDRRRQRRRAGPELAQAPARLVVGRAGRLPARAASSSATRLGLEATLFYLARLPRDERRRVRGDRRARARDRPRRPHRRGRRHRASRARGWRGR